MTRFIVFSVGAFCSEAMALKAGNIVLSIALAQKRNIPGTCMKNVLSPFESGGGIFNGLGILYLCSIIRGGHVDRVDLVVL